jgi:hypothetical protein
MMQFYHGADDWLAALGICEHGFADRPNTGVQLVDRADPLKGRAVLRVEVAADEDELVAYEVGTGKKHYREWVVPAAWLNRRAAARAATFPATMETKPRRARRRTSDPAANDAEGAAAKPAARTTKARAEVKAHAATKATAPTATAGRTRTQAAKKARASHHKASAEQPTAKPRARARASRPKV